MSIRIWGIPPVIAMMFIIWQGGNALFISCALALEPKVCVAALSLSEQKKDDETIHQEIQSSANILLKEAGYENPSHQYIYKTGTPKIIRECLEGSYEDVIIIAQSSEVIKDHYSIVYRTAYKTSEGKTIEKWVPLDRFIFRNLKIQKSLRQITLIFCNPDEVLEEYGLLRKLAKENKIYVKFQPVSFIGSVAQLDAGIRAQNLVGSMIAESAQFLASSTFYCLLRTHVGVLYEYGFTSCLRNHYHISLHGPLSVGLKTSTKWVKLKVDLEDFNVDCDSQGNCAVLDLELAFLRGVNVNISRSPIDFTRESFGVSVSPFQYLSVTKIP